jgi:low temperature requirement protein LtrA
MCKCSVEYCVLYSTLYLSVWWIWRAETKKINETNKTESCFNLTLVQLRCNA